MVGKRIVKSGDKMMYDVIIIGAGAAGLYCGAHLKNLKVLILEKNQKPGLKILASGGGQCNLTHGGYINAFYAKYGAHKSFVKNALKSHDNKEVVRFFQSNGCKVLEREDGKVFPASLKASDVVKALIKSCSDLQMNYGEAVKEVEHDGQYFSVITDHASYKAPFLVISTGGKSYPTLGTTGDGYILAKDLGHAIVSPKPGLTGVVTKDKSLSSLQGVSVDDVELTLFKDGKANTFCGPLLFTHFGLSGPVVLNNSRYMNKGDQLSINFVNRSSNSIENELLEMVHGFGDKPVAYWLNQLGLVDTLKRTLFEQDEILKQKKLASITKEERKLLMGRVTSYKLEIESLIGYQNAMVTVGGIDLTEVDPKRLASKVVEGLYFCGEVLDVDGDTGGYNLQWAFSSGYAVANGIIESNKIQH